MARKRFKPVGIIADIPREEVSEENWTSGSNVQFRDLRSNRVSGLARVYDPPLFAPKFLIQSVELSQVFWIYASDSNIGVVATNIHTDLTPSGGITPSTDDGEWTGGLLNGVPVLNNGARSPMYWTEDPLDNFAELPDWPAGQTTVALRPFKNHLFALGTRNVGSVFGSRYQWSDAADEGDIPRSWTPLPTTEAGDDTLSETRGPIIDGLVLRDQFIIYKRTSCYQVDYVAGNAVFANRLLFAEVGILARNCVAEVYGEHYVFTPGDFIKHDGYKVTTLADQKVRAHVFRQMDPETFTSSYVTWDPLRKTVWFCFPTIGHRFPNLAAIYDIKNGDWGFRDLPNESPYVTYGFVDEPVFEAFDDQTDTYDETSLRYNQVLYSNAIERCVQCDYERTRLYAVDVGNTFDSVLIEGILEKETIDMGDNSVVKTVNAIWPRAQGQSSLQVRLGSQVHPSEGTVWGDYVVFAPGTEKIDYFVTGRYISVGFKGDEQQEWAVSGFDLEYEIAGNW